MHFINWVACHPYQLMDMKTYLQDSLSELYDHGLIPPGLVSEVLVQYDRVVNEALANRVKTRVNFHSVSINNCISVLWKAIASFQFSGKARYVSVLRQCVDIFAQGKGDLSSSPVSELNPEILNQITYISTTIVSDACTYQCIRNPMSTFRTSPSESTAARSST